MKDSEVNEIVDKCPYETKLAITCWVIKNICENAEVGGSFRYLIYNKLGFSHDAYVPLYLAGGMNITNELDLQKNTDQSTERDSK